MRHSKKVVLALGSNLGNRRENLAAALGMIGDFCRVVSCSRIYQTPPVGYAEQRDFLNAALAAETDCDPLELLALCKALESKIGRRATFRNGPRAIDIDIIFYGDLSFEEEGLTLPHPRWSERDFVKTPLIDLLESGALASGFPAGVREILERTARAFAPYSAF